MALGASQSTEPIREGLVSMLSPAIDTLLVCTLTALAILVTGVWQSSDANGVSLTATAFQTSLPGVGKYLLLLCALPSPRSFSYSYYGSKALAFLIGVKALLLRLLLPVHHHYRCRSFHDRCDECNRHRLCIDGVAHHDFRFHPRPKSSRRSEELF